MNISLLLIEISQNEKGLYKLTSIINKYNTCVCARTVEIFAVSYGLARAVVYNVCYFAICYALFRQAIHLCGGMMLL